MAFNEKLADRIREIIGSSHSDAEEKKMFGGLCFMVDGKMCVGVESERMMVRFDPARYDEIMEKPGAAPMDFTGRVYERFRVRGCLGSRIRQSPRILDRPRSRIQQNSKTVVITKAPILVVKHYELSLDSASAVRDHGEPARSQLLVSFQAAPHARDGVRCWNME